VYLFAGTMLWAIFMDAITAPMGQTQAARGMLAKLSFPREDLLVAGVYKTLFCAVIKIGLLLCILPFFRVNFGWGLAWFSSAGHADIDRAHVGIGIPSRHRPGGRGIALEIRRSGGHNGGHETVEGVAQGCVGVEICVPGLRAAY
jgi:hypothetical protein